MRVRTQSARWTLAASIRFLLWWGAGQLSGLMPSRPRCHREQRARRTAGDFPQTAWVVADNRALCLVSGPDKTELFGIVTQPAMDN